MCGIIGYSGHDDGIPLILNGIKNLEYRGYDSFGVAFIDSNRLIIKKDAGRIDDIIEEFDLTSFKSNMGIAHTRWDIAGDIICIFSDSENQWRSFLCSDYLSILQGNECKRRGSCDLA